MVFHPCGREHVDLSLATLLLVKSQPKVALQDDAELQQLTAEYAALRTSQAAASSEAWRLPDKEAGDLQQLVNKRFEAACQDLLRQHEQLGSTEADNARTLNTRCHSKCGPAPSSAMSSCARHLSAAPMMIKLTSLVPRAALAAACPAMQVVLCRVCEVQPAVTSDDRGVCRRCTRSLVAKPALSPRLQQCWLLCCRGDLPEEQAQAYERQRRSFEALQRAAGALADALDRSLPALPEGPAFRMSHGGVSVVHHKVCSNLLRGIVA